LSHCHRDLFDSTFCQLSLSECDDTTTCEALVASLRGAGGSAGAISTIPTGANVAASTPACDGAAANETLDIGLRGAGGSARVVSTVPAAVDAAAVAPRPSRTSRKEGTKRLTREGVIGGEPSPLQRSALERSWETGPGALRYKAEKEIDAKGWRSLGPAGANREGGGRQLLGGRQWGPGWGVAS
jgi:hypothetical protein